MESERPKLTIETKQKSTGNEGLDAEKEWRDKAAMCEHKDKSVYLADKGDDFDPMLCDMSSGGPEQVKSNYEETTNPDKHPAVTKAGDSAWLCNDCQAIICDNCAVDYSDSSAATTTASQADFPVSEQVTEKSSESNSTTQDSSRSLLDDFADTSLEPLDYTGGDD